MVAMVQKIKWFDGTNISTIGRADSCRHAKRSLSIRNEKTKVEENSINPLCIPPTWPIYVDPKLLDVPNIICGSGLQKSKLLIPSKYLLKLPNVELVADLAKEIKEEKNE